MLLKKIKINNFFFFYLNRTIFTMNFMEIKPHRGFYKVAIQAGSVSTTVAVKVLSEVKLDYLEIGTGDADQTTQSKLIK